MGLDLLATVSETVFLQGSTCEGGATCRSAHGCGLDDYQPFALRNFMLQFPTDSLVSLYKLIAMSLELLRLVGPTCLGFLSVEMHLLFAVPYTWMNRLLFYVMFEVIWGRLEMVNKE